MKKLILLGLAIITVVCLDNCGCFHSKRAKKELFFNPSSIKFMRAPHK